MNFTSCTVVILLGYIMAEVVCQTPGPAGIKGQKGQRGRRGKRGNVGAEGPIGPDGSIGSQGIEGATGPDGAIGSQGPKGDVGIPGSNGQKGDVAPIGATGIQGPEGVKGSDGQKGDTGPGGATGIHGAKGDNGTCPTPVRVAFACGRSGSLTPYPGANTHIPLTECTLASAHFELTTSKFTAPVTGIYFFHYSAVSDADWFETYLYINGQQKHRSLVRDDGDHNNWQTAGSDLVVQLSPGDVVDMRVQLWPSGNILGCGPPPCTVLTGFLLYEM